MDWKVAIAEERAALMRIVALLHALADLAELAANRSPAVRAFVLWLLRHAETLARDFVAGEPGTPLAPMPVVPAGGGPADAMRLAIGFRALARQLDRQARLAFAARRADSDRTEPPASGRMPAMRAVLNALSSIAAFAFGNPHLAHAPDTS